MIPVCLVFRAHEPYRLRPYNYFDVGRSHDYFDPEAMRRRLARVEESCYGPATDMLQRLLERHPRFCFSLSLSGPLLEQLSALAPRRLTALRRLVEETGRVEPLAATSHHCLPWAASSAELEAQIRLHRERVRRDLGREPAVFGGEEPPDPGTLAALLEANGFAGMLLEGRDALPAGPARRRLYRAPSPGGLPILVGDKLLSKEIARRFSTRRSPEWPPTAEQLDGWTPVTQGSVLCLSMDLATFGLRSARESGIDVFEAWVARASSRDARFLTPSEVLSGSDLKQALPSAATSVRAANEMQQDALAHLSALERRLPAGGATALLEDFRRLSSSDHFAQMALHAVGAGVEEPGPFESPYEAYMAFRHAVADLERRLPRPRPERALSVGPAPA